MARVGIDYAAMWNVRQTAAATVFAMAIALAFATAVACRRTLLCLFAGLVLSTAVRPPVAALGRLGLPAGASVCLLYAMMALVVGGAGLVVIPLVIDQSSALFESLPDAYRAARQHLVEMDSLPVQRVAHELPENLPRESLAGSGFDLSAAAEALRYGRFFVEGALVAVAIAAFALFWSLYRGRTIRSCVLLLPDARRADARELIDRVEASLSAYVRGQAALCLMIGLVDFVVFHLIGVPFALPLALVAGMLEAVPFFGPLVGPVPAILMAFSVDPVRAVWVMAAAVVIQNIEGYLLAPKVMQNAVGVHGFVMLLAITGFGALMGVLGAILAVPLAAVAQALLEEFLFQRESAAPARPVGRDSAGRLCYQVRELLRDVQAQIRDKHEAFSGANDALEETLEAIALDLERGVTEAGDGFVTQGRAR